MAPGVLLELATKTNRSMFIYLFILFDIQRVKKNMVYYKKYHDKSKVKYMNKKR